MKQDMEREFDKIVVVMRVNTLKANAHYFMSQ